MKKFRKENEIDDLDFEEEAIEIEEKKDDKKKVPKIILNIILIAIGIVIIFLAIAIFSRLKK